MLFRHIERNRFQPILVLPSEGSLRKPLEDLEIEDIVIESEQGWLKPDIGWYNLVEGLQSKVKSLAEIITNKQMILFIPIRMVVLRARLPHV